MIDTPPPRKRGRPKGSKDSYLRERSCSKLPKPTTIEALMPAIRELVDIAELNGYHKGCGRPNKRTQEGIDRCITRLLAATRMVIPDEH